MLFQKQIKIGELVRSRVTREIWLVVHKTTQGLFVINLMVQNNPPVTHLILQRDSDSWDRDTDIDDLEDWEKNIVEKKMPLIEEVEKNASEI